MRLAICIPFMQSYLWQKRLRRIVPAVGFDESAMRSRSGTSRYFGIRREL